MQTKFISRIVFGTSTVKYYNLINPHWTKDMARKPSSGLKPNHTLLYRFITKCTLQI